MSLSAAAAAAATAANGTGSHAPLAYPRPIHPLMLEAMYRLDNRSPYFALANQVTSIKRLKQSPKESWNQTYHKCNT